MHNPPNSTELVHHNRIYAFIMNACGALAAIIFGLMSLLVASDVILRNIQIELIPASIELTEYMLMTASFIAAPWLLYKGEHIRIDVITTKLPKKINRYLDIACNLICLIVCSVLTWQSFLVLIDFYQQETLVFKELIFPEWRLALPLLIGAFLLSIEFIRRIFLSITS